MLCDADEAVGFESGIRKPEKEKEIRWSLWVGRVCNPLG